MLADDLALVGDDLPFAARRAFDRGDGRVAVDLAAAFARAPRQRLRQIGGLDIAVLRMLDRADDAVGVAERPDLLDLLGRQELHLDADRRRDARVILIFVEAVRVRARRMLETWRKPTSSPVSAPSVL